MAAADKMKRDLLIGVLWPTVKAFERPHRWPSWSCRCPSGGGAMYFSARQGEIVGNKLEATAVWYDGLAAGNCTRSRAEKQSAWPSHRPIQGFLSKERRECVFPVAFPSNIISGCGRARGLGGPLEQLMRKRGHPVGNRSAASGSFRGPLFDLSVGFGGSFARRRDAALAWHLEGCTQAPSMHFWTSV